MNISDFTVLYINLAHDTHRKELIEGKLNKLKLKYERIDGICGKRLRDDDYCKFEVFMGKRHKNTRFLSEHHVFPGGAIEEQDMIQESRARLIGPENDILDTVRDVCDKPSDLWICASLLDRAPVWREAEAETSGDTREVRADFMRRASTRTVVLWVAVVARTSQR